VSRNIRALLALIATVIAAALIAAKLKSSVGLLHAFLIIRAVFPWLISWGDHDEFKKCPGAIERPSQWPAAQADACEVMRMCVNEAPLTDRQEKALYGQLRKLGCEEP
jgi:hypothetical protein